MLEQDTGETQADRYLRLAVEYEHLYLKPTEAEMFMGRYSQLFEGDSDKMLDMGKFYLRIGKLDKADEYLRDAYSFNIKNQVMAFNYACFLLQLNNRQKEAIVILNKLAVDKHEEVKVNLLLSMAYELDGDSLMG